MADFAQHMQLLSVQFVPFVMAVVFHEVAHGFIAKQWGDKTAQERGRLTFNPIPHIDLLGTVIFPLINMAFGMNLLFGWAKPVPIDPRRFRKYRPGLFWVSFAGPGMNFLLACFSAVIFCMIRLWMPPSFYLYEPLMAMAYVSVSLNYALGIFNLIPLPPLDGSKMIEAFLSPKATLKYESLARYSFFILMGLLLTGAFSVLAYPIRFCTSVTLFSAAKLFHLPEVLQ